MYLFATISSCHTQHCAVVWRVFECSSLRACHNRYVTPHSSRSTPVWICRAPLHAEFADAQGGGTEERRREDEKPLPWAHAYCRGWDGQPRAMSRTQWLHTALTRPGCATAAHCLTPEKVLRAFSRNDRRASARAPRTTCRSFIPGGRNRSLVRRSVDRQV